MLTTGVDGGKAREVMLMRSRLGRQHRQIELNPISRKGVIRNSVSQGAKYGWQHFFDGLECSAGWMLSPKAVRCARTASGSSSEEVPLKWNKWVRQTHRWLSIAFTVAVIVNIVAVVQGKYSSRVGLLAVFPLALLLFTGLYLFVLPYATKWGSGQRTD
jgi:hypothetical protein